MDFSPTPKHLAGVKQVMDMLVPDYLERIPGEHLHDYASICAQINNLHWQMDAVDVAREEHAKEDAASKVKSPLLQLRRDSNPA